MTIRGKVLIVILIAVLLPMTVSANLDNGDFETGTFANWTMFNTGMGSWFVYTGGNTGPISTLPLQTPPEGAFAAMSDGSAGTHILYRDFALAPGFTHTLSFTIYYTNYAAAFAAPASLDYAIFPTPNQQYRIDLMNPAAPVDSVAAGDVISNLFQTIVGSAANLPPTLLSFDLTPLTGTTVRLRFAEVDNQFYLNAGVDAVNLVSTPISGPTTPTTNFAPSIPASFTDGRINRSPLRDVAAPVAVYCATGSINVYAVRADNSLGYLLFSAPRSLIDSIGVPIDFNVTLASGSGVILSRLTTGEFQINAAYADGKPYIIVWRDCSFESLYHLAW